MIRKDCGYPIHDYLVPAQLKLLEESGLQDEVSGHVENCDGCFAALKAHCKYTLEELKEKWKVKEPERVAWMKFHEDCERFYKTWRGKVYFWLGGPYWSRRAKLLGIPHWEDYKPKNS